MSTSLTDSSLIDLHLQHVPEPPLAVLDCLQAFADAGVPNPPNTGQQSSPGVVPGVWPQALVHQHRGLSDKATSLLTRFAVENEAWRNLSKGGPPSSVAIEVLQGSDGIWGPSGKVLSNSLGPIKPTLADMLHFDVKPWVLGHELTDESAELLLAQLFTLGTYLVNYAKGTLGLAGEDNARAIAYALRASADLQALLLVRGALGADNGPLLVAKAAVKRLQGTVGTEPDGTPRIVWNEAGKGQSNHGHLRGVLWMQDLIGDGLARWADLFALAPELAPVEFQHAVLALYRKVLAASRWVHERAEEAGAPLGGCWSTYDVGGKFYLVPSSTPGAPPKWDGDMIPFGLLGRLAAKRWAPQHWEFFRPRIEAWLGRTGRLVFKPHNPLSMGMHDASIAPLVAAEFGYRVAQA